jgi:hypothetical protein
MRRPLGVRVLNCCVFYFISRQLHDWIPLRARSSECKLRQRSPGCFFGCVGSAASAKSDSFSMAVSAMTYFMWATTQFAFEQICAGTDLYRLTTKHIRQNANVAKIYHDLLTRVCYVNIRHSNYQRTFTKRVTDELVQAHLHDYPRTSAFKRIFFSSEKIFREIANIWRARIFILVSSGTLLFLATGWAV